MKPGIEMKNISSCQAAGHANPKLGLKLPLRTNLGETIGFENWVYFHVHYKLPNGCS
jgi:hypothetical protein